MANNFRGPRRTAESIVDVIGSGAALSAIAAPKSGPGFAKLSLSVAADLARSLRIAAVVDHNVSESALVEVAIRRFLALPASEQTRALAGIGRRRKQQ
jgi:hypothetical protein